MMVPGYLLRTLLTKHRFVHRLVPYASQSVMRVPSYGLSLGSLMCRGGAPGTPQVYARPLYTSRYLLNQLSTPKPQKTEDNKENTTHPVLDDLQEIVFRGLVLVVLCILGYRLFCFLKDVFDPLSPSKLYAFCYEQCQKNDQVTETFGFPICQYGVFPEKILKQHVTVDEYVKGSSKYMRVTFHISGPKVDLGIVTADLKVNPGSGTFDVEYIFVNIDTEPKTKLILEDNRNL